jgi:hypothetical protein
MLASGDAGVAQVRLQHRIMPSGQPIDVKQLWEEIKGLVGASRNARSRRAVRDRRRAAARSKPASGERTQERAKPNRSTTPTAIAS